MIWSKWSSCQSHPSLTLHHCRYSPCLQKPEMLFRKSMCVEKPWMLFKKRMFVGLNWISVLAWAVQLSQRSDLSLYCFIIVSLYQCITVLMYHCINVSLYQCITVLFYHSFICINASICRQHRPWSDSFAFLLISQSLATISMHLPPVLQYTVTDSVSVSD